MIVGLPKFHCISHSNILSSNDINEKFDPSTDVGNELNFIELETMTNEKCKETIPSIPEYVVCIDLSNGKCFNAVSH